MRPQPRPVPGSVKILGSLIIVVLPLIMVTAIHSYVRSQATLPSYAVVFLLVALGAQAGLILRRWGNINIGRLIFDLMLAVIAGVLSWLVVGVAIRRGGGPVDPSLVAVIMAYILAAWSGQHP